MTNTFMYLTDKYGKIGLNRKCLADELDCSLSTIDRLIAMGIGLPSYKRIGSGKRARIIFPIAEVVEFLETQLIVSR